MPDAWILSFRAAMAASSRRSGLSWSCMLVKAFGLDELQVGVGILAEDAEFGLPTRSPVALRLAGGSRGHGSQNGASRNGHETKIMQMGVRAQGGGPLSVPVRRRRQGQGPNRLREKRTPTLLVDAGFLEIAPFDDTDGGGVYVTAERLVHLRGRQSGDGGLQFCVEIRGAVPAFARHKQAGERHILRARHGDRGVQQQWR